MFRTDPLARAAMNIRRLALAEGSVSGDDRAGMTGCGSRFFQPIPARRPRHAERPCAPRTNPVEECHDGGTAKYLSRPRGKTTPYARLIS
jgi:hypothetical protein